MPFYNGAYTGGGSTTETTTSLGAQTIAGFDVGSLRVVEYRRVAGVAEIWVRRSTGVWVKGQYALNSQGFKLVATDSDWANVENLSYGVPI